MSQVSSKVSFKSNKRHKLDPKGRVAVPSSWGVPVESTLVLMEAMRDEYPVIKCYTEEGFEAELDKVRRVAEEHGQTIGDIDDIVGEIAAWIEEVEVNGQNKMLIPRQYRERLKLGDMVVLAGRRGYFEIWNPEDFDAAYPPTSRPTLALDKILHLRQSRIITDIPTP